MSLNTHGKIYSLKSKNENSNSYYLKVSRYTDKVISKANNIAEDTINDYLTYISINFARKANKDECILEFLILGVLWQTYLPLAINSNTRIKKALYCLTEIRDTRHCKKLVDPFRGILATLIYVFNKNKQNIDTLNQNNVLNNFQRLINWLTVSGEFSQEVVRLKNWYEFLSTRSDEKKVLYMKESLKLAQWFMIESEIVLGEYTVGVNKFLDEQGRKHYWSEDVIFCNRKRVEYHLNMVGAEILNRVYRQNYLKSRRKIIMLPACMRIKSRTCEAERKSFGYLCKRCNKECNAHRLTCFGEKHNLDVYILPHESMLFSKKANKEVLGEDIGIIGIACPLNLISGGWKSIHMDIPAQCVLLDYCGCKNHWEKKGTMTDINYDKLAELMGTGYLKKNIAL